MKGRLILLAHAETDSIRAGTFSCDEPLNERGRRATESIRSTLPRGARAWRSSALAAGESATILGLEALIHPALADLDCGAWRGRGLADVLAADPGAVAWMQDPDYRSHGGLSIAALFDRVGHWLEERKQDPGTSLAVSHAAVVRCAIWRPLAHRRQGFGGSTCRRLLGSSSTLTAAAGPCGNSTALERRLLKGTHFSDEPSVALVKRLEHRIARKSLQLLRQML